MGKKKIEITGINVPDNVVVKIVTAPAKGLVWGLIKGAKALKKATGIITVINTKPKK